VILTLTARIKPRREQLSAGLFLNCFEFNLDVACGCKIASSDQDRTSRSFQSLLVEQPLIVYQVSFRKLF
jgi:hypothetical protein